MQQDATLAERQFWPGMFLFQWPEAWQQMENLLTWRVRGMVDVRLSLFSQDSSWVHGRIKESGWESASWHQWSNASGLESFIPRIRYCSEDQLLGGFRGSEMCFEQVKDNRTTGKSSSLSPGQYLLINTHYKVFLDWDKPPLEASFPGFPLWFMTQSTFSLITKKCLIK